jgi:hypothetical protein
MRKAFQLLRRRLERNVCPREVEEELQFHIEMQARDYEREGLSREDSMAQAQKRFGDFSRVRSECIKAGMQSSLGKAVQKGLFSAAFLSGVFIRSLDLSAPMTRMGDVLIMIAVFGGLRLMGKSVRMNYSAPPSEPLRLGLLPKTPEPHPVAFDENGRTPFERVRADL